MAASAASEPPPPPPLLRAAEMPHTTSPAPRAAPSPAARCAAVPSRPSSRSPHSAARAPRHLHGHPGARTYRDPLPLASWLPRQALLLQEGGREPGWGPGETGASPGLPCRNTAPPGPRGGAGPVPLGSGAHVHTPGHQASRVKSQLCPPGVGWARDHQAYTCRPAGAGLPFPWAQGSRLRGIYRSTRPSALSRIGQHRLCY